MHHAFCLLIITVSDWYCKWLNRKQLEIHGCILSTVANDTLLLKHQAISIPSADFIFLALDQLHTKIFHLQGTLLENKITFWKYSPSYLRLTWGIRLVDGTHLVTYDRNMYRMGMVDMEFCLFKYSIVHLVDFGWFLWHAYRCHVVFLHDIHAPSGTAAWVTDQYKTSVVFGMHWTVLIRDMPSCDRTSHVKYRELTTWQV